MELGENYFSITDYTLLISTLLISLLIGLYYGYKSKHTNEELLVGGRNMSILPVAASIMVTYVSAITIIGLPSEVYAHGSQIFVINLVAILGFPISAFLLMPFFYQMKLTSVNEYLEKRFNSYWIRRLASSVFIFQQVTLSAVILYAPSLALEAFLGFPVWISIFGVGICATLYTNIGGIKAVVWADAFQFLMMVTGMIAIVWRGVSASGGVANMFQVAEKQGRLQLFDFTFDPFMRHNFWNLLVGSLLHSIMQPGVHQMQVQRYSGMPTCSKAKQAIISSVPLNLIIMGLCVCTGYAILAFYATCDPLTKGEIQKIDQILPYFVVHELADIPGMMGIFTSCIFCAVLSSLSSSLNSISAVIWEDFLVRKKYFRTMSSTTQTNISRMIGVTFGFIYIALAFAAQNLGSVYTASYAVLFATAGSLYGVFLMALFLPFTNAAGAVVGMLSGFTVMIVVSLVAFVTEGPEQISLPVSVESCPSFNMTTTTLISDGLESSINFDEWPWKVFRLSYLLYPVAATITTVLVGIFVSLVARIYVNSYKEEKPLPRYVHPAIRKICRCFLSSESSDENENTRWTGDISYANNISTTLNSIKMNGNSAGYVLRRGNTK